MRIRLRKQSRTANVYSDAFIKAIDEAFAHGATDISTVAVARRHGVDEDELWQTVCEISRIVNEPGHRETVMTRLRLADELLKKLSRGSEIAKLPGKVRRVAVTPVGRGYTKR